MSKQTSANNELLSAIKTLFNKKIYKRASEIMNSEGDAACLEYINKFCNDPYTVESFIKSATDLRK